MESATSNPQKINLIKIMKKLNLKPSAVGNGEKLTRDQLKKVLGGDEPGTYNGGVGTKCHYYCRDSNVLTYVTSVSASCYSDGDCSFSFTSYSCPAGTSAVSHCGN